MEGSHGFVEEQQGCLLEAIMHCWYITKPCMHRGLWIWIPLKHFPPYTSLVHTLSRSLFGATLRPRGCKMAQYAFPPFHSFPPSYTRQPVEATRAKQTQLWCDLIRDYCRVHRIFWLDVSVARESNLFSNPAIDRRLSDDDVRYFLGQLVARGDAEWDPDRKRCLVFWRQPSDWGQLIYQWVDATGKNGELLTVHEIRKGSATVGREFHGLELDTTIRALQALEAFGKCAIVQGDSDDSLGVKFAM